MTLKDILSYNGGKMETIFKSCKRLFFFSFIFALSNNVFGACNGGQRGGGFLCSPKVCTWERSDQRCNDSSECCPGKMCNSFGYCELCC